MKAFLVGLGTLVILLHYALPYANLTLGDIVTLTMEIARSILSAIG